MNRMVIALCFVVTTSMNAQNAEKLTLKQVLALVAAAPDQVAANEIRQRGVADPVSRNDVAHVQQAGGGPRTLEALRRLIMTPVLVVRSNQDQAEVLVDSAAKGTAGPTRPLIIRDADPGRHTVTVRKSRYSTVEMPVTLTAGKTNEVAASLELSVAFLSIATNAPNAGVEIEGVELGGHAPSNLELAPGSYVIHVNAPRFAGATQEVTLKAGETRQLQVPLAIDPNFTRSLVTQAQNEQAAGHYADAFKLAANALAIEPTNGQALSVEAMSAFYGGQYPAFAQFGLRALQAGGRLDIPVVHRHALRSAHLAFLKLQSNTISYNPDGQPGATCNTPAFQVPITDLQTVELKQDTRGQRYLEMRLASPGLSKPRNFIFADYRSRIETQPNGLSFLIAPPNGVDEITSTAGLLQSLLQGGHP
jgi:hypothetical protein